MCHFGVVHIGYYGSGSPLLEGYIWGPDRGYTGVGLYWGPVHRVKHRILGCVLGWARTGGIGGIFGTCPKHTVFCMVFGCVWVAYDTPWWVGYQGVCHIWRYDMILGTTLEMVILGVSGIFGI